MSSTGVRVRPTVQAAIPVAPAVTISPSRTRPMMIWVRVSS